MRHKENWESPICNVWPKKQCYERIGTCGCENCRDVLTAHLPCEFGRWVSSECSLESGLVSLSHSDFANLIGELGWLLLLCLAVTRKRKIVIKPSSFIWHFCTSFTVIAGIQKQTLTFKGIKSICQLDIRYIQSWKSINWISSDSKHETNEFEKKPLILHDCTW